MERPFSLLARHLPRPGRLLLGSASAVLGLWLITRPVTSATTLAIYLGLTCLVVGLGELLSSRRDAIKVVIGVAWTLVGVVAVVAPGETATALPIIVAAALAVSGLLRLGRRRRGPIDVRLAAAFLGVAEIVLGAVALAWPDATIVVAAVVFGIRAVVVGVQLVWDALIARERVSADDTTPRGKVARTGRVLVSVLALALSLGALWFSDAAREAAPVVDDFYAPPAAVPDEPGRLVRAEAFTREVPVGARGWRILYTSTDQDGSPALASGLVVVPTAPAPETGRPVIAWAHGTTGQATQCAPSLLAEPFTAGAFPEVMDDVVERGWAIVATDYLGLGAGENHAYLVGQVAGQGVLDAVRAARELEEAEVGDDTVVWGHSQGGAAALWTAQVQPTYAPEVALAGTVAMAPASDPRVLADGLADVTGGSVFAAFVIEGYAQTYDDVRIPEVVRPAAVPLVAQMASRCLSEPGMLVSVLTALSMGDEDVLRADASAGPLGARLDENMPLTPGESPLLVAQGVDDALITPQIQRTYVRQVRRGGRDVDFRVFEGRDHLSLVQGDSAWLPELLAWTEERFGHRAPTQ